MYSIIDELMYLNFVVRPPESLPLSHFSQLAHGLTTKYLTALDETQLARVHPPNPPLGVRLVEFVVRGRVLAWGQRGCMPFRQTEHGVRFRQRERNGMGEWGKGVRRGRVVSKDERREEITDARKVSWDERNAARVDGRRRT